MRIVAHKIALQPTRLQEEYFRKACGVARFAYNWGLAKWKEMYAAGTTPSSASILKSLRAARKQEFPWIREVTKWAPQLAIEHLQEAFTRFYTWIKNGRKGFGGHPQFKKKGKSRDSFCSAVANTKNESVETSDKQVKLPKIGWVRMHQKVRFEGRISQATISRKADRWFVTLLIHTEDIKPIPTKVKQSLCGVDLGIRTLATIHDGTTYQEVKGPKPHKKLLGRLRRLSQSLSRKQKGSNNRAKAKIKLARLHARIANIRQDCLHKLTTQLAKGFQRVCVEDLNVAGMLKNHRLARSVSDMGFGEFRRQLTYKCKWYGSELVLANRFFPSSKTCPECKVVNADLGQGDYEWTCPNCKAVILRDRGAAKNLFDYAAGLAVSACGANQPLNRFAQPIQAVVMKQEST